MYGLNGIYGYVQALYFDFFLIFSGSRASCSLSIHAKYLFMFQLVQIYPTNEQLGNINCSTHEVTLAFSMVYLDDDAIWNISFSIKEKFIVTLASQTLQILDKFDLLGIGDGALRVNQTE